jgi:NhaP-type Na+/H+ or K+/H+ antiporter
MCRLDRRQAGWLDPRGIAALVLGVIFILETDFVGVRDTIALTVFATVLLSAFIHGASGLTAVKRYGRIAQSLPDDAAEKQALSALPSYRIPLQ